MFGRNVLIMLGMLFSSIIAFAAQDSVLLQYQVINNFAVKYVVVNMRDPDVVVTTAVARSFPYGLESWGSFLNRLNPDAAINGTYFCPHSYQPVGDVAVNGDLLYRGSVGTALCITPDNRALLLPGPRQARSDWTGCRTVLCAGPRLLTDGEVTIDARAEGFRDPHVLGSARRSAVAIRGDGALIFLTVEQDISLGNLAHVCQRLGAVQAMNLDGGSSSGLYADGRSVTRPSRSVSNIIAIYATQQRFAAAVDGLVPSSTPVLAHYLPEYPQPTYQAPMYAMANSTPAPMTKPVSPTSPSAAPAPLVRFVEPNTSGVLTGTIPIAVQIAHDPRVAWCSLRINGQLRAMSNTGALKYSWDSRQDADGPHTLEVSVWSHDRDLLAMESRKVTVRNTPRVAAR